MRLNPTGNDSARRRQRHHTKLNVEFLDLPGERIPLYLTRDIPSLIMQGGFQIKQMETAYIANSEVVITLLVGYCDFALSKLFAGTSLINIYRRRE